MAWSANTVRDRGDDGLNPGSVPSSRVQPALFSTGAAQQGVQGLRPLCLVAESGRRGDQGRF